MSNGKSATPTPDSVLSLECEVIEVAANGAENSVGLYGAIDKRIRIEATVSRLRTALERVMTHPSVKLCECGEPDCATRQAREALSGVNSADETCERHPDTGAA